MKNGFSRTKWFFRKKKIFRAILDSQMMASLNPVQICATLLAHHRVVRNIPDASFTFTERLLGKTLLPSEAILHGLVSISIDSSFFVS